MPFWRRLLIVLRILVAIALISTAWPFALHGHDLRIEPLRILIAVAFLIPGLALLWPWIFRLAIHPFTSFIEAIYSPKQPLEKPLLNLSLPTYYINESRYEEALEEYQKILRYYPREAEAYEKAIWLEAEIFHRPRRAIRLVRRAKRHRVKLDSRIIKLAQSRR